MLQTIKLPIKKPTSKNTFSAMILDSKIFHKSLLLYVQITRGNVLETWIIQIIFFYDIDKYNIEFDICKK